MAPIKLSAVIITFNEEKNIARCIDSVMDIADDIVVVDSFSTDGTEKICMSKGVRFIKHHFEGHIEQKNWALTQAKFPHVLSLDADEALSGELKDQILKVKNGWKHDGYSMNRLTNYCGKWIKHCGWYPDKKLRLWDSRKGHWTGTNPHDRYELIDPNASIGHLKGDIIHYSCDTISDHVKQVNYFTDIAAKAYLTKGKRSNLAKMLLSALARFIRCYFIRLGFLDGYYGFVISVISSCAALLKYAKLKELQETDQVGQKLDKTHDLDR